MEEAGEGRVYESWVKGEMLVFEVEGHRKTCGDVEEAGEGRVYESWVKGEMLLLSI